MLVGGVSFELIKLVSIKVHLMHTSKEIVCESEILWGNFNRTLFYKEHPNNWIFLQNFADIELLEMPLIWL